MAPWQGVRDLGAVLALSADAVREASDALVQEAELRSDWLFGPVFDGELLPEDPYRSIAAGSARGIPLLHGTTADEYHYWLLDFRDLMQRRPRAPLGRLLVEALGVPEAELPVLLQLLADLDPASAESERYLRAATLEFFRWPHARLAEALADRMQDSWVAFARHGDPSHPDIPHWPPFASERGELLIFDTSPRLAPDPERALRKRWEALRGRPAAR